MPMNTAQTIALPNVEGRIDHLAVDLAGHRLFVAALGNNTIEVIDLNAGRRTGSIHGVKEPQGIVYVPSVHRLYAAGRRDHALSIFDTNTLALVKAVPLPGNADNVRYDVPNNHVYVGYGDGAIGQFDLSGTLLGETKIDAHPESFQLERNGPRIFVNLPDSRKVVVLDRKTRAILATWNLGSRVANFPLALDEKNRRVFIGCRTPARLLVLHMDTGKEVAAIPTVGDTDDLFYDEKRRLIYVIGGEGAVAVIAQENPDVYREKERISTAEGARTGWFSPDLDRLYVALRKQGQRNAEIRAYAPR